MLDFDLTMTAVPAALAFFLCLVGYPIYIRWLRNKQIGQYIREEGPASHAVKAKTPTMGGLAFISSVWVCTIGYFLWTKKPFDLATISAWFLPLGAATACAFIGIADDYGKVTSKSNKGLSAGKRLMTELMIGAALAGCLLYFSPKVSADAAHPLSFSKFSIPFGQIVVGLSLASEEATGTGTGREHSAVRDPIQPIAIPVDSSALLLFAFIFSPFVFAGTANALNLHDGMDGLAAGTSLQVFALLAYMMWLLSYTPGSFVASATAGALAAFLIYNRYPAKVFMGDTGSLFVGALIAALALTSGLVLWLIPIGIIYILETVSVMAQVTYFKLTKPFTPEKPMSAPAIFIHKLTKRLPGEGKRLMRMAPIHHHFEAVAADRGIKEWEVVLYFWLAQATVCSVILFVFRPY